MSKATCAAAVAPDNFIMSLLAITREVSSCINECELSFHGREAIDVERARAQHAAYRDCLAESGVEARGFSVRTIDVSELQKAEAGVTCCSLIFEDKA